ncbi:unnamed protein product [Ascophyllum nodosum]
MELMRSRVEELDRDLADATVGKKEQAIYASHLKEALDRRSSDLRGVRGLLATAHKRCEELEAKLRPRLQQESGAWRRGGATTSVEARRLFPRNFSIVIVVTVHGVS